MIGWLEGCVRLRDPLAGLVVIDAGGVGYQVTVSVQTLAFVGEIGASCQLWIHTHVREDALVLFGFATPEEKRMFQLLISVPQVGPKNAIGVLGGFPIRELAGAIHDGERDLLERIPGVGKRTAERILLDLKDKIEPFWTTLHGKPSPKSRASIGDADHSAEARAVLVNLGWKSKQVDIALEKALESAPSPVGLDTVVRSALAILMAR